MPKIILIFSGILFFLFTAFTSFEQSILGNWHAPDLENSTVKIYRAPDGFIYGKIIESDESKWIDKIILKKVSYQSKNSNWTGTIYSPKRDMTIDATLSLASDNKLKIVGKKFFMTKTFYWTK